MTEDQIKILTEDEAFWDKVIKTSQSAIEDLKKQLKLEEAVLEMAERKFKEAK